MLEHLLFSNLEKQFIQDRISQNKSPKTITLYSLELKYFKNWFEKNQNCKFLDEINPQLLREWFADLSKHRNPGGVHCNFRVLKTMLNWVDFEYEMDWKNPIRKVNIKPNRTPPLKEIPLNEIQKLLDACVLGNNELRDRAILLTLTDTGVRGSELVALNIQDVDYLNSGRVEILHGKGNKYRVVWLGKSSKKAIREYIETRSDAKPGEPLFLTDDGRRMQFFGLRMLISRLCNRAGIKVYGVHCFRRSMALATYRQSKDIFLVSKLLGHSKVEVTVRYLNVGNDDLRDSFMLASPADLLN